MPREKDFWTLPLDYMNYLDVELKRKRSTVGFLERVGKLLLVSRLLLLPLPFRTGSNVCHWGQNISSPYP